VPWFTLNLVDKCTSEAKLSGIALVSERI